MATTTDTPKTKFKDVQIVRQGKQIILPATMSYAEGRLWLQRQEDAEEKIVAVNATIPCFPLDGVIAFRRALEDIYGFAAYTDTPTFFGPKPPVMVQVEMYNGKIETAPIGRMNPPMYENGYIECMTNGIMSITISGQIKKKFEDEVKRVIEKTKEFLAEKSIYRGTSFILNLDWMDNESDFHPVSHAPKFMDVSEVNENGLILNRETLFQLTANIFTLLERTEDCRRNAIPLKHGCLLVGRYGTGKTLTARVTASKAVRNNWTFIYLKTPKRVAEALKLAEMYAPAVLFTEDIDDVVNGERDDQLNQILNTLDGVDTKDKPIITVLTTNHADNINPAMLRAGRIDTIIKFSEPDAEAAVKFVMLYAVDDDGQKLVSELTDSEWSTVGQALSGFVPAFIAEAVQKAKRVAIHRHGADILGKVTAQDLLDAADGLKTHRDMVEREQVKTSEQVAAEGLSNAMDHAIKHITEPLMVAISDVKRKIDDNF